MQTATEDQQKSIFDEFRLAKYRIELRTLEPMILPKFKGSMLRGGFGHVFRRICCASREATCDSCLLRQSCPYVYVFETMPPVGSGFMAMQQKVPHPYVFEPPLDDRTEYGAGEELIFHLILIGRGIEYLPYFIFAIRELGEVGIATRRHKFELSSIHALDCLTGDERLIYSLSDNLVRAESAIVVGSDITSAAKKLNPEHLTLRFLTPTRIKYQGSYCFNDVIPIALVQNLTVRINALSYFHCGGIWDDNLKSLRETALGVHAEESSFKKRDVLRYSNRQRQRDSLSGIVGEVTYKGDLKPLLPILLLGQFVHVGSDAVFGCGKYELL
ncbi:CRISPR system precrRNA processing endoribonuclease RAMP protein Cas6 [Candidatus Aquicultor secundus]|uniref:CRISPR system precrRNA processing endoribonuclease RAMP protein Cas6 n=1 Tax=Candidatus Aquicultor secundus TaxID=1973895 RepID=UPI00257C38B9|nr:CRISPR system precrRNA processing endoribonuclease RAMP protein Cas6 [Candidatus Aquicultor secundus]